MLPDLPSVGSGIHYAVCEPSDVPELCTMLARTFTQNDPPAVAVGLTRAEFERFVSVIVAPEATQRLTLVARDAASGVLAGALLSEDAAGPAPDGLDALSPKFAPIFELFEGLEQQMPGSPTPDPGATIHLFLLGVDGRYTGRGIAQRLIRASLTHASAKGYRTAVTEATNLTSQHLFAKAGFTTQARVSYADYQRDGVAVFASIADEGGPAAMLRQL